MHSDNLVLCEWRRARRNFWDNEQRSNPFSAATGDQFTAHTRARFRSVQIERNSNENWIYRLRYHGQPHGGEPAETRPFIGRVQSNARQGTAAARSLRNIF